MRIIVEECLACGACVLTCPQQAIEEHRSQAGTYSYSILAELCTDCREQAASLCRGVCPVPECLVQRK